MTQRPPSSTLTHTPVPCLTRFRSARPVSGGRLVLPPGPGHVEGPPFRPAHRERSAAWHCHAARHREPADDQDARSNATRDPIFAGRSGRSTDTGKRSTGFSGAAAGKEKLEDLTREN